MKIFPFFFNVIGFDLDFVIELWFLCECELLFDFYEVALTGCELFVLQRGHAFL